MEELLRNLSLQLEHPIYEARLLTYDGVLPIIPDRRPCVVFNRMGLFWIFMDDFWAVGEAPAKTITRFAFHAAEAIRRAGYCPSLIQVRANIDEIVLVRRSKPIGRRDN